MCGTQILMLSDLCGVNIRKHVSKGNTHDCSLALLQKNSKTPKLHRIFQILLYWKVENPKKYFTNSNFILDS